MGVTIKISKRGIRALCLNLHTIYWELQNTETDEIHGDGSHFKFIHPWIRTIQGGTSNASQIAEILALETSGCSWRTMAFLKPQWEASLGRRTAAVYSMWKMCLGCFEYRFRFARKNGFLFRAGRGNAFSRLAFSIMISCCITTWYEEMKETVTVSCSMVDGWMANVYWNSESFVSFVHLFSNKSAPTRKSVTLVAYFVYVILSNESARRWWRLIDNGRTVLRILLVVLNQEIVAKK